MNTESNKPNEPVGQLQGRPIHLTDKFTPFAATGRIGIPDQPVLITLHNQTDQLWCCVFSTVEALHAAMDFAGITNYKIKKIDDGREFAESVLETGLIRLMLDPQIISKERTKWTEIVLE